MPPKRRATGPKLLCYDRALGARFVAGADEAGRGPLAGPLVIAGVCLDYACLRDHKVRPLALLNDSKQVDPETRDELYRAVLAELFPGKPIRAALVWTDAPDLMEIPAEMLDTALARLISA